MKLFKIDGYVFSLLSRIFDIIFLNVLWVFCSIPIITIGASTSALYYCMLKINRETDGNIMEMFFKSFRQNLKQGSILTIILLFSGIILYIDFHVCVIMDGIFGSIMKIIVAVLIIVWGMLTSYAFPMLAQFDNTVLNTLKKSLILSFLNVGKTIPVLLVNVIPIVLFFWMPYVFTICFPMFLTFGIAFMALVNSRILVKVFDEYI